MRNYIIKRLFLIPFTLLGILAINFAIIQFAPGGPVEYMLAKYQGLNVDAKAQFTSTANVKNTSSQSQYRGAQGVPEDLVKELEKEHHDFISTFKENSLVLISLGMNVL